MKVNMNIYFPCSPLPFMIILAEFCNFGYFSLPNTGKKQEYLSTGSGERSMGFGFPTLTPSGIINPTIGLGGTCRVATAS